MARQRAYFASGATLRYETRLAALQRLHAGLERHEPALFAAFREDLGRPDFESYLLEIGFCRRELRQSMAALAGWMKPRRVRTPWRLQPATSMIRYLPLGVNLIIAPYNYPLVLALSPLIAALAAGNTAVVKSSELAPASSAAVGALLAESFPPEYVAHLSGGVEESTQLLGERFDHIFFTGSARVGRVVMAAAARNLTPVTLELGGKSPCIVHHDANLTLAVKRIVQGKFVNCGQTCVAPDFVLVHERVREEFLRLLKERIRYCYGPDPRLSPDYGRMVSEAHFRRLAGMIAGREVVAGGEVEAGQRYIAPTVLEAAPDDPLMAGELFGPVLPVLGYGDFSEVSAVLARLERYPLAAYIFSASRAVQGELLGRIRFGGGCINHCLMHLGNPELPFGGLGESGFGNYHGFDGFARFSQKQGMLRAATWFDLPLLYPPYGRKLEWLRRLLG